MRHALLPTACAVLLVLSGARLHGQDKAGKQGKRLCVFYLHAGPAETAHHQGALNFHKALQKAGVNSIS